MSLCAGRRSSTRELSSARSHCVLSWALPSNRPAGPGPPPARMLLEPRTGNVALWGAAPEAAASAQHRQRAQTGPAATGHAAGHTWGLARG
jgi:hypothetical protein